MTFAYEPVWSKIWYCVCVLLFLIFLTVTRPFVSLKSVSELLTTIPLMKFPLLSVRVPTILSPLGEYTIGPDGELASMRYPLPSTAPAFVGPVLNWHAVATE